MLSCPSCAAPVPSDLVIAGVAQCPACEHVFEAPAAEPEPPAPEPAPAPAPPITSPKAPPRGYLPSPPSSVRVKVHPHGVQMTLPWRTNLNLASHLVLWLIMAVFTAPVVQGGAPLPLLVVPAVIFYNWLYLTVNHSTILVAKKGIVVTHGPLPTLNRSVSLGSFQLRRVFLERDVRSGRHGRKYTVYHLTTGTTQLLHWWTTEQPLAYVKEVIEAVVEDASPYHPDRVEEHLA